MTRSLKNKYGPWVTGEDFYNRDAEVALLTRNIDGGGIGTPRLGFRP